MKIMKDINKSTDIYIPELDENDDFLKHLVKLMLIEKKISLKDYKDNVHILKFGSVNFVGWQPVKADIPSYIPQDTDSFPQTRTLKLERIILRSTPNASTDNTFFFFDQIKVLTETFEVNFDGEGLEKNFDSTKDETKESEKKVDNPK